MNNEEKLITWILCQFANNIENIKEKRLPPITGGISIPNTPNIFTYVYSIDKETHIEFLYCLGHSDYKLSYKGVEIEIKYNSSHIETITKILGEFRNYEMKKSIPYQQRQKELESVIRELRI